MFTIEHEFDATVITLIDESDAPLREDGPDLNLSVCTRWCMRLPT